jgi:hypothetical protein
MYPSWTPLWIAARLEKGLRWVRLTSTRASRPTAKRLALSMNIENAGVEDFRRAVDSRSLRVFLCILFRDPPGFHHSG